MSSGIIGKRKTEKEYRLVQMDSYSSLKDFSLDRKKYYKKYILGESVEEEETLASTMGRIVETLLFEPELFDERFYMSSIKNIPEGLMGKFVQELHKLTKEYKNNEEVSFTDICKLAYEKSGFKWSFDTVISKFSGSDVEIYYNELCQIEEKQLSVVSGDDVTNAEKIVEALKISDFTGPIVNLINSHRFTVENQFQVEGYSVDGHIFKSMIDKMIMDTRDKTIDIYDLKCTWNVENFYEEYYLRRRSYMQAYLYYKAVESLTFKGELQGYTVNPPKFIVCDSINYYAPIIYTLSQEDLNDAYFGFIHKGRTYPGVKEVIENLKWAINNDVWNISRKNYELGGFVNIKG